MPRPSNAPRVQNTDDASSGPRTRRTRHRLDANERGRGAVVVAEGAKREEGGRGGCCVARFLARRRGSPVILPVLSSDARSLPASPPLRRDDERQAGAKGATFQSARWRDRDEARGATGRSATASAGSEGRRGSVRGGWGCVARRVAGCVASVAAPTTSAMPARRSAASRISACCEDAALLRTLGGRARRARRARVRSEKICEACGRRGRCQSERAARRGDDGRAGFDLREIVVRSTPAVVDATARTERVAVTFGVVQLEHPEAVHHRRRKARRLGRPTTSSSPPGAQEQTTPRASLSRW